MNIPAPTEAQADTWGRMLAKLEAKYSQTGQDMDSYLEGLLYQDYLNYWDYIHTDTLLSLQATRTQFPDEQIFIIYHQITELNFKLIRSELHQITTQENPSESEILKRVTRVNRYLTHLVDSFDIMGDGMDQEQFMRFRMALLPASGFQSAQFRQIEFACTDGWNLIKPELRRTEHDTEGLSPDLVYEGIYWRQGATDVMSGQKTLTLRRFEEKYSRDFLLDLAALAGTNLRRRYRTTTGDNPSAELREALLRLDKLMNVEWRLVHMRSAMKYLQKKPVDLAATGGTNWQKYLPPHFQLNRFFPELGELV